MKAIERCVVGTVAAVVLSLAAASRTSAQPGGDPADAADDPSPAEPADREDPAPGETKDAEPDAPPAEAKPEPGGDEPPQPRAAAPGDWHSRFASARARMVAGEFEVAASAFDSLVEGAPDEVAAALSRENARLCRDWIKMGYFLTRRLGGRADAARLTNVRTTSELAGLYLGAVGYGLFSGATYAVAAEPDSAAGVILPSLFLAGASSLGVYALDKKKGLLGYGVAQSITTGVTLGFAEGTAWTLWNQARVTFDDEWDSDTVMYLIWGAGTLGAIAGGVAGARFGTTPGRASLMGSAGVWSGLVLGMTAAAFPEDIKKDDWGFGMAAVGLTAGALGGALVGEAVSPSSARVRFIDLGGISGALVAGGLYVAIKEDDLDGSNFLLVTSAGIATGLGLAWYFTNDMEPDYPRGGESPEQTANRRQETAETSWAPMLSPSSDGEGAILGAVGQF